MRKTAQAKPQPGADLLDPATLPEIYGMLCVGDCMAPEIPDGSRIAGSRSMPYQRGDIVFVWLRPEIVLPGGPPAIVKRLIMVPPPWVKAFPYKDHPKSEVLAIAGLGMNSMPDQMMTLRCADILAIHRVVAVMVPGQDEGYRSILREGDICRQLRPEPEKRRRRLRPLAACP